MRLTTKVAALLVLTLIVACWIYDHFYSEAHIVGLKNEKKYADVKLGMTKDDLLKIMGHPNRIEQKDSNTVYYYSSTNVDYMELEIRLDTRGLVSDKYMPFEVNDR